jgi:hypothetical protein
MFHPPTILTSRILEEDARRAGERAAMLLEALDAKRSARSRAETAVRRAQRADPPGRLRRWLRLADGEPLRID